MFFGVKFLCGRPNCDQDSTATLQIDAPSSTVSLVDPKVSRDGVPLCDRHAESTTAPLGWAMNDMRSRPGLKAVPDDTTLILQTPPRVRPKSTGEDPELGQFDPDGTNGYIGSGAASSESAASQMSKRQSIQDRAQSGELNRERRSQADRRRSNRASRSVSRSAADTSIDDAADQIDLSESSRAQNASSRRRKRKASQKSAASATPSTSEAEVASSKGSSKRKSGSSQRRSVLPATGQQQSITGESLPRVRPSKRRELTEDSSEVDEKFPWLHQFEGDIPEELQATSPLLARAFRATGG